MVLWRTEYTQGVDPMRFYFFLDGQVLKTLPAQEPGEIRAVQRVSGKNGIILIQIKTIRSTPCKDNAFEKALENLTQQT